MTCAEIEGNEVAVVETSAGPRKQTLSPGLHFLTGIRKDVFKYPISDQTFIMGQLQKKKLGQVNAKELEGKANDNYESKWIRPEISRIIKDLASTYTAKEIYAAKRTEFNDAVEHKLEENRDFGKKGIIVKTFVLDQVRLEKAYEKAISDTMLQEQLKEKAEKETQTSIQAAIAAREKAQASVEIKTQQAEAKKQERVKAAEAERFESEQKAIGLLAQGKAEAQVAKLKKNADYDGVAGERRMKVEIAKFQAEAAKGLFANANVVGGMTVEAMMRDLLSGLTIK
jgi:regulator of protease activity HflC (stomatin/prohibitin superfamily)